MEMVGFLKRMQQGARMGHKSFSKHPINVIKAKKKLSSSAYKRQRLNKLMVWR